MTIEMTDIRNAGDATAAERFSVILVEDDHDLRQSLADYLRLSNMLVTEAASGIAFYRALQAGRFDIAVLDVNLPDTSGFDLAADVAGRHDMGVILLTARIGREDRVRGYGKGADIYLTKPVDSEELALAIGNLARRMRLASSAIPEVSAAVGRGNAGWQLDRRRRTLHAPGIGTAKLSARETMLLELLARHGDATVSRAAISSLFGDAEPDPESRRLDAALARLRAKLKAEGMDLPFQVVHSVGLRLVRAISVA